MLLAIAPFSALHSIHSKPSCATTSTSTTSSSPSFAPMEGDLVANRLRTAVTPGAHSAHVNSKLSPLRLFSHPCMPLCGSGDSRRLAAKSRSRAAARASLSIPSISGLDEAKDSIRLTRRSAEPQSPSTADLAESRLLSLLIDEEVATGHRGVREREPEGRPDRCTQGCRTSTADMCHFKPSASLRVRDLVDSVPRDDDFSWREAAS